MSLARTTEQVTTMTVKRTVKNRGGVRARRESQKEFLKSIDELVGALGVFQIDSFQKDSSLEEKRKQNAEILKEAEQALKNREKDVEPNAVFVIRNNEGADEITVLGTYNSNPLWTGAQLLRSLGLNNSKSLMDLVILIRELNKNS